VLVEEGRRKGVKERKVREKDERQRKETWLSIHPVRDLSPGEWKIFHGGWENASGLKIGKQ